MKDSRLLKWCLALLVLIGAGIRQASAQSKDSATKVKVQLLANLEGQDDVHLLAFSPDGEILAADNHDVTVWLWDVSKRKRRTTIRFQGGFQEIDSLAFSPDGKRLAVESGWESLRIWDLNKGTKVLDLKDRSGGLSHVAFSPDWKMMASAGMRLGPLKSATGVVKWRETKGRAPERTLAVHDGPIDSIEFSPDGKTLALLTGDRWHWLKMTAADWNDMVAILATRGGASGPNMQLSDPKLRCVLKLVDLGAGKVVKSVTAHKDSADLVKFSPDGRTLATGGGDAVVKLWDVATLKERCDLKGHNNPITSLAFSADGKLLASADAGSVKLWDVASGQELREASKQLKGGACVAFTPKGCILATGCKFEMPRLNDGPGPLFAPREVEKCVIRLWRVETSPPPKSH